MKQTGELHLRRMLAVLLTVVMLLTGWTIPALAQEDWAQLLLYVSWPGLEQPVQAYAIPGSLEQAFWVQVDGAALTSGISVNAAHPLHAYTFDPAADAVLTVPVDAQWADGVSAINITAYENDAPVDIYKLYVSTSTIPMATIPVQYLDSVSGELLAQGSASVAPYDVNALVYPDAALVPAGYTLVDETPKSVYVDAASLEMTVVTFYCQQSLQPADVTIRYIDAATGAVLNEYTETYQPGEHTIYPDTVTYAAYTITPESAPITVNGAPVTVEFMCTAVAQPADVTIRYIDVATGAVLNEYTETYQPGEHTIYPDTVTYAAYTITPEVAPITVNGAPVTVEFMCTAVAQPADVTIRYIDAATGAVLSEYTETYQPGDYTISPDTATYAAYAITPEVAPITVNGAPVTVEFMCTAVAQPADVTIRYIDAATGAVLNEYTETYQPGDYTIYPDTVTYAAYAITPEVAPITVNGAPVTVEFVCTAVAQPADVTIRYIDAATGAVLSSWTETYQPGNYTIYADTETYAAYTIVPQTHDISVNGTPVLVDFVCTAVETAPVEPAMVPVTVRYLNSAEETVYEITADYADGSTQQIWPDSSLFPNDVITPEFCEITVNAAEPNVVEFRLTPIQTMEPPVTEAPTEEPPQEPLTVPVTVIYQTSQGVPLVSDEVLCVQGQTTYIEPRPELVPEGYVRVDENVYQVTVDELGYPSANPVTFTYEPPKAAERDVLVIYQTADGVEVARSAVHCVEGENVATPDASLIPEGYALVDMAAQVITLFADGTAQPDPLVFLVNPVDPPIPQGEMIQRWGVVNATDVALRRTMVSNTYNNIERRLAKNSMVYVLREELDEKGNTWMRVLYNGGQYFMMTQFITLLSSAESDQYMAQYYNTAEQTPVPPMTPQDLDGAPTTLPTDTPIPTDTPTLPPTDTPTLPPTDTPVPTDTPTLAPTDTPVPTDTPTLAPTDTPIPTDTPTLPPTDTPIPTDTPTLAPTETPIPTDTPTLAPTETPIPTDTPTLAPTETPEPYYGYALTVDQVALRTGISQEDNSIITTLPKDTLVTVQQPGYAVDGTPWSVVATLDDMHGMVPDSSLRRINDQEAQYYLNLWADAHTAPPTETPEPTAQPVQIKGYASAIGDGVPYRNMPSSVSVILGELMQAEVVYVEGQEYVDGAAWHVVQYGGSWVYVQADMLRMLTPDEEKAYLDRLNGTPEPTLLVTPPTYNPEGLSSYGYVSASSVNFRSGAGTNYSRIATLRQYAFCLVLGSEKIGNTTWYHVNYGGKDGYVSGEYFKQLSISELETFLTSEEYRQGLTNNAAGSTGSNVQNNTTGTGGLVSREDQLVNQWTNPNSGLNVSYEPFNPFATPGPVNSNQPTSSPSVSPSVSPSASPTPTQSYEPMPTIDLTGAHDETDSGSPWGWVIAIILLLIAAGGVYIFLKIRDSKRQMAQRAAQRRAQAARGDNRPYARNNGAVPTVQQPRTGTYPNQNGPSSSPTRRPYTAPTEGMQRKPDVPAATPPRPIAKNHTSDATVRTGYERPVQPTAEPQNPDAAQNHYTASYRQGNDVTTPRASRRTTYRQTKHDDQETPNPSDTTQDHDSSGKTDK